MGYGTGSEPHSTGRTQRDLLQDYLTDIAEMSPLESEEQLRLFERMESAEAALRDSLAQIPEVARILLARWNEKRAQRRVTGSLSRWHRDGSNRDLNNLIDDAFVSIDASLTAHDRNASTCSTDRRRVRNSLAGSVRDAELALPVLFGALETLEKSDQDPLERSSAKALRHAIEHRAQLTDAKNLFISHNLRLVILCAKNYRNQKVPFLDLIQEGNLGLVRAVEKFDYRRGYRFSTYAIWWIEQSLVRAIANDSRTVRLPSPLIDQQRKLKQLEQSQRATTAAEPTALDLIEKLGINAGDADDLRRSFSSESSTQAQVGQMEDLTLEDTLVENDGQEIMATIDDRLLCDCIQAILPTLTEREQLVLEARFGLRGNAPRSLNDIGSELGLSRERIRQIENRALEQLRENQMAQSIAAEFGCL